MTEPWMLDELDHAGPEHLDPAFVANYDRKQGTDAIDDVAVLREHGLDSSWTVVDLGAGTGRFALAVAPHVSRVVAVDVSPAMLAHVREQVAAQGLTNVECVQAGFLSYEHGGAPADAVYMRNALHQVPDFWKVLALRRIVALLRPGGLLRLRDLIYDCEPDEVAAVFERWFERAADDPAQGYTAVDFAEHIREEHSTFRWLLEPMLARCGFAVLEAEFRAQAYGAYTCRRR